ncbi:MAG: hypothetical protein EHM23_17865 [Acidobacteria bacterium]|nr:MAG: hypothetical protein EHM23_17865 [Acidobacteriota bacterium]
MKRQKSRLLPLLAVAALFPESFGAFVFGEAPSPPRLILIKVDGLSPLVLDAAINPSDAATDRLPHPELFREAHLQLRSVLKRDRLLPNIEAYFYRSGVRSSMYCATLPLSSPSWAVIDTGQRGIVKSNSYFNRFTGELTSYLDQLRESLSVVKGAGRTTALWQLDLLEIPLVSDFFPEGQVWTSIQPFYRKRPTDQLSSLGKSLITRGEQSKNPLRLIKRHVADSAYGADYPERNDQALASLAGRKVLETGLEGKERYDFLSVLFASVDHQFHVDPHYENILSWLMRVDDWIGEILSAVEQSERRDSTLVVLMSDHGLDFDPVRLNYSFPINRWLREAEFGGHTVLAPVVEDTEHALTVPVRGVDFTRIYESLESAFGSAVLHGEKGYATAYTDNTGNPRFDAYLRNSDLNRLHLVMLEVLRCRKHPDILGRIFPEFTSAFAAVKEWLGPEIQESLGAASGLLDMARRLSADADAVRRLTDESAACRRVASALERLAAIPVEKEAWLKWARRGFRIPELIPKGYFGQNNTAQQLQSYVTGWETPPEERWKSETRYRNVNYTKLFPAVQATSGNSSGNSRPFHFFSMTLPVKLLADQADRAIQQAIWLVFPSAEALILESEEGEILYRPLQALEFVGNDIRQTPIGDPSRDPLGYSRLADRWMLPREWADESTRDDNEWQLVPLILSDLFRDNFRMTSGLAAGSGNESLAREFHFSRQTPDFRVWTFRGWNVNSNSHTPGGSHGNFTELDVKTIFSVWGGGSFPLRRGELVSGAFLTSDIVPTLLSVLRQSSPNAGSRPEGGSKGKIIPILSPVTR